MAKRVGRKVLLQVTRRVADHYHATLLARPEVVAYLGETRQIADPETAIRRYGLGYAPARGEGPGLEVALRDLRGELGMDPAAFRDVLSGLGLLKQREGGAWRDVFRGRVLFPFLARGAAGDAFGWHGERAEVVGFGGRILPAVAEAMPAEFEPPKYLNTSDTALFSKRDLPFGLFPWAARAIAREGVVFIVEGYFDWLRMQLIGAANTIAVCGTSLTAGHIAALQRVRRRGDAPLECYLLTDSDMAGRRAADSASELLTAHGLAARIMPLLPKKDVDESLAGWPIPDAQAALRQWMAAADWPVMVGLPGQDDAPWTRSLAALHFGFRRARRFAGTTPPSERDRVLNEMGARLRVHGRLQYGAVHLRQVIEGDAPA